MKKLTIALSLLALATHLTHAQDKVVTFKPEGKNKLLYKNGLSNGLFYTVTGMEKGNATIVNYDENLNVKFEKSIPTKYKGLPAFFGRGHNASPIYYDLQPTNGKYVISYDDGMVFNEDGGSKAINFERFEKNDKEQEQGILDRPYFKFYSDNYACFLGRKEVKKGIKDQNIYLFRRSLEDQSTKCIKLEEIETSEKYKFFDFRLGFVCSDKFYLVYKELKNDNTVDIYKIVGYNYEGEIISRSKIDVKLKNKYNHFAISNCGFGIIKDLPSPWMADPQYGGYRNSFTTGNIVYYNSDATSNFYIDSEKECIYVYGLFSNEKFEQTLGQIYTGFYVQKYNFDGLLLWTSENQISDEDFNEKSAGQYLLTKFYFLNDTIGLKINRTDKTNGNCFMYLLNSLDGKITKNKKSEFKIDGNTFNAYRGGSFETGYMAKESFGKLKLDIDALFAAFASPKVEKFLSSQPKDAELNYGCSVNEKGVYLLEEDNEENKFRLMKFNW